MLASSSQPRYAPPVHHVRRVSVPAVLRRLSLISGQPSRPQSMLETLVERKDSEVDTVVLRPAAAAVRVSLSRALRFLELAPFPVSVCHDTCAHIRTLDVVPSDRAAQTRSQGKAIRGSKFLFHRILRPPSINPRLVPTLIGKPVTLARPVAPRLPSFLSLFSTTTSYARRTLTYLLSLFFGRVHHILYASTLACRSNLSPRLGTGTPN